MIRIRNRGGERVLYARVRVRLPTGERVCKEVRCPVQRMQDARNYEIELRRAILEGRLGVRAAAPTLQKLFEDAWTWQKANRKPASARAFEIGFRTHLLPTMGERRIDTIDHRDIAAIKERMRKDSAPKTVNNTLGYLHRALTLARKWKLLDHVPDTELLEYDSAEAQWLDTDEVRRFLAAAGARRAMLLLLVDTGLRIGECLALRWKDVDLPGQVLVVRRTRVGVDGSYGRPKEGPERSVPLTTRLVAELRSYRHLRGELIFTTEAGAPLTHSMVKDWVPDAVKRAGIAKHITNHSLRHTTTAHLVMAGVDESTIMAQMGWKTPSMVRRYAHLSPAHKRSAVEKLEALYEGGPAGTETPKSSTAEHKPKP